VAILREHLLEGKPVSKVCQQHQLQPTVFYAWQKTFFENARRLQDCKTKEGKHRQIAALQESWPASTRIADHGGERAVKATEL
jgi:transposase-like protein